MADPQDIVDPLSYLEDFNEIADSAWYESLMPATNQSFQNGKNEAKKRGAEKPCNSQQSAMRKNRKFTKEEIAEKKTRPQIRLLYRSRIDRQIEQVNSPNLI
ncbi:hypothetical protein V6Z12_D11G393300 [Gossypium hirsutum]